MKKVIFIYTFVALVMFVLALSVFGQEMSLTEQRKKLQEMERVLDNLKQINKTKLSSEIREKRNLSEKKLEEKIRQLEMKIAEEEKRTKAQRERIRVQQNKDAKYLTSTKPLLIAYIEALKKLRLMELDETQSVATYRSRLKKAEEVTKDAKSKLVYIALPFSSNLKEFHTLFIEALDSTLVFLEKADECGKVENDVEKLRKHKEEMLREASRWSSLPKYRDEYLAAAKEDEKTKEEQTEWLFRLYDDRSSLLKACKLKNYEIVEPSQRHYELKVPLLYDSATEAQLALGRFYMDKKRFTKAIVEYKKAVALEPNSARVHSHLETAYWSMGQMDRAIEECKKTIQLVRESDSVFLAISRLSLQLYEGVKITKKARNYYHKRMYKKAITEAEKAIERWPSLLEAYLFVIMSYSKQNEFDKITPFIGQMLVQEPIFYDQENVYGLKIDREELNKASAKFGERKKEKPEYVIAHLVMEGIIGEKKVEDIDCDQLLASFSEKEIRESPLFCLIKGLKYEKDSDKGRALRSLEKASSLDLSGKIGEIAREKIQSIKESSKRKTIFDLEESEE